MGGSLVLPLWGDTAILRIRWVKKAHLLAIRRSMNAFKTMRQRKAAKRFLAKALNGLKNREKPTIINTDKAPTNGIAIAKLMAKANALRN
jgi:transposase-like protein